MCYILTNEQRRCFGLTLIEGDWEQVQLKKSPYDSYDSYAYIQGQTVKKLIQTGEKHYCEYTLSEILSEDRAYLQPKTQKGKPVKLSASVLEKRPRIGMALRYSKETVMLYNATTDQGYFRSYAVDLAPADIGAFSSWVNGWCADTTEEDVREITEFSNRKKVRKKYAEGDFFRIRLDRRLWAYGRILLDYGKLGKQEGALWDIFLKSSCLVVGLYHVLTDYPVSDITQLLDKPMLPAEVLMDNIFYYGEAQILGNRPLQPYEENYPIHYGRSLSGKDNAVMLQYGKLFCRLEGQKALYNSNYLMNGISFFPGVAVPLLQKCIRVGSNQPYWDQKRGGFSEDLRNPKFWLQREQVFAQFGLRVEDHVREDPTIPTPRKPYMNENCAKLLSREESRPNGAKLPTRHYTYECSCGKGIIREQSVVAFGRSQDWVRIECRACKKKYSLRSGHGHRWELE